MMMKKSRCIVICVSFVENFTTKTCLALLPFIWVAGQLVAQLANQIISVREGSLKKNVFCDLVLLYCQLSRALNFLVKIVVHCYLACLTILIIFFCHIQILYQKSEIYPHGTFFVTNIFVRFVTNIFVRFVTNIFVRFVTNILPSFTGWAISSPSGIYKELLRLKNYFIKSSLRCIYNQCVQRIIID